MGLAHLMFIKNKEELRIMAGLKIRVMKTVSEGTKKIIMLQGENGRVRYSVP